MKTGVVFEGGAVRTVYSCGVMDALLDAAYTHPAMADIRLLGLLLEE